MAWRTQSMIWTRKYIISIKVWEMSEVAKEGSWGLIRQRKLQCIHIESNTVESGS